MSCPWFCVACLIPGLYIVYKLLDCILRIPYIGRSYKDSYVFITGCDSGFGCAAAKRLDSLGCHVFAGCLTEKAETELKKTCSDRLMPIPLDVTKPDSVRKAFQVVQRKLVEDGTDLWGMINNAGIMGRWAPPEWTSIDDYRSVYDVNLFGTIDVTMTFLPLIKLSRGRVVNVASVGGRISLAITTAYSGSKYGVEAFSDGLRRSLRPYGCNVSIIEPGNFNTNFAAEGTFLAAFERSWMQTSLAVKEEFGVEYYNGMSKGLLKFFQGASPSLSPVVDAFEHALFGRYPRARYLCGIDAKLIYAPLIAMPEWLSDWILDKMLAFMYPVQAALQKSK